MIMISCGDLTPSPYSGCSNDRPERVRITENPLVEKRRVREIVITPLDYGFVLKVGCKSIALDSPQKLLFGLKKYLANPNKVEDEFLNGKFKFEK